MLSFAIIPLLASFALAAPAPAISNAAAFTVWGNPTCSDSDGSRETFQNIPSNSCQFLPGAGLEVDFLAPGCTFQVFKYLDCDAGSLLGTFTAGQTCIQSISFSAYNVVCS